jgi:hypothetical protein
MADASCGLLQTRTANQLCQVATILNGLYILPEQQRVLWDEKEATPNAEFSDTVD